MIATIVAGAEHSAAVASDETWQELDRVFPVKLCAGDPETVRNAAGCEWGDFGL